MAVSTSPVDTLVMGEVLPHLRATVDEYPERVLIASIMEEYRQEAWVEIIERCQAAGVDGIVRPPDEEVRRRIPWVVGDEGLHLPDVAAEVDQVVVQRLRIRPEFQVMFT